MSAPIHTRRLRFAAIVLNYAEQSGVTNALAYAWASDAYHDWPCRFTSYAAFRQFLHRNRHRLERVSHENATESPFSHTPLPISKRIADSYTNGLSITGRQHERMIDREERDALVDRLAREIKHDASGKVLRVILTQYADMLATRGE